MAPWACWPAWSVCIPSERPISDAPAPHRGCLERRGGRYASLFGSKAFTGKLDARRIPHFRSADGEALVDAHGPGGLLIPWRHPRRSATPKTLAAYVELHIEQGLAPRGRPHPHRLGGGHRGQSARLGHLHRPGRSRGHDSDGVAQGRLSRAQPSTPWPRAAGGEAGRREERHQLPAASRSPRRLEHRPRARHPAPRDARARRPDPGTPGSPVPRAGPRGGQAAGLRVKVEAISQSVPVHRSSA